MTIKYIFTAFLISLCLVICSYSQVISAVEKTKWTRIEMEDKDFSFAVPPNFILDREKREKGAISRIYGFENDVRISIKVYSAKNAKASLPTQTTSTSYKSVAFSKNNFDGVITSYVNEENIIFDTIALARENTYYLITIVSTDNKKPQIKRFFQSIKLKDEYLYRRDKNETYLEETVSVATLTTSPEVVEAYHRKLEKKKINVTKQIASEGIKFDNFENYSRPPIILEGAFPVIRIHKIINGIPDNFFTIPKIKLNLLADGQIGDITFLTSVGDNDIKPVIEAAQKFRFIPAQIDGKNTDSSVIIDFFFLHTF